jgi:hypothetical protein
MNNKVDYTPYLRDGETLETVLIGTLRKRRFDQEQKLSEEERERLKEERLEQAQELAERKRLDVCFWGETSFRQNAETAAEEIAAHRAFLKAFRSVPDVLEGESLRRLAKRTLIRLCRGNYGQGGRLWVDGYSKKNREFTFEGFVIHDCTADWFENNWVPPADMTEQQADEPIDVHALESWPNFGRVQVKERIKPVPVAPPVPVFEAPDFRVSPWGYSTRNGIESNALAPDALKYLMNGG